jgi:hypothetical protein
MSPAEILELYQLRFQIELLFRDAKQNTGLGHAPTLDAQGQAYFANASLTALNLFRLEERDQAIMGERHVMSESARFDHSRVVNVMNLY